MAEVSYVIPAPEPASLSVAGSMTRFPVRRVWCVGRNYAEHAREMGKDPDREPPFFFQKPADAIVPSGSMVPYPPDTKNLHHEIELVVAIGRGGVDIEEADAQDHVWGATVGIDLTRRDRQGEAKETGRPWEFGKAFDRSAPMAALVPLANVPSLTEGHIWLAVDGTVRQDADIKDMIWTVAETISYLSRSVALSPGDIIMTGTPAGVGPVGPGETLTGGIDGLATIETPIGPPLHR